jgi:hypothetical protein
MRIFFEDWQLLFKRLAVADHFSMVPKIFDAHARRRMLFYAGLRTRIHFIRIRIQGFNDQKLKKNYSSNFFFFWSKTAIYLSLGLHKVCPSYRRSLQLSKEAIQHFKTWAFTKNVLLLLVIFALLDPDSESGSGSTDPIESGSNPDPDPQPWFYVYLTTFR